MRVLVTGAGGYLGSRLVTRLAGEGVTVIATARTSQPPGDRPAVVSCELADAVAVERLVAETKPDAVVHAAARIGREGDMTFARQALRDNVTATANLVAAFASENRGRFILCSTISVYPHRDVAERPFAEDDNAVPRGVYGRSKYLAEETLDLVAQTGAVTAFSLRFAGIHGPPRRSGVVSGMATAALLGPAVDVAEPRSKFRFVFVDDAVSAVCKALRADVRLGHHRLNIAGAETLTLRQLANRVVAMAGTGVPVVEAKSTVARQEAMAIDKARAVIGYAPRATEDGLQGLLVWLRAEISAERVDSKSL